MSPTRHYAVGTNIKHGDVQFNNNKKKKVTFDEPFDTVPHVQFTLADSSSQPPYRLSVAKDSFFIRFTNKYTGIVSWEAKQI